MSHTDSLLKAAIAADKASSKAYGRGDWRSGLKAASSARRAWDAFNKAEARRNGWA